jgi:hypothetical protein
MKKLLLGLLTVSVVSFLTYSCKKNQEDKDTIIYETTEINKKNDLSTITPRKDAKYWLGIGLSDLAGGAIGFKAGGAIGAHWGAVVGAVLVGGSYSYAMAICCGGYNPNNLPKIQSKDFYFEPKNSNNPYDDVGFRHNQIVAELLHNNNVLSSQNLPSTSLQNFNQTVNESIFIKDKIDLLNELFIDLKNNGSEGSKFLKKYADDENLLRDLIYKQFIVGYNSMSTIAEVKSLVFDYENYVKNNNSLNENDKAYLLSVLSIARHSSSFWYHLSNN